MNETKVYTSLVPQMDEYGEDTGMEMLQAGEVTYPNLFIRRGLTEWSVAQVIEDWYDDYDEFGYIPDEYIEYIGDFPVAYNNESVPFLRSYSEEETNAALLKLLSESEYVWSA